MDHKEERRNLLTAPDEGLPFSFVRQFDESGSQDLGRRRKSI